MITNVPAQATASAGVAALPPTPFTIRQTPTSIAIDRTAFGQVTTMTFTIGADKDDTNRTGAQVWTTRTRWEGKSLVTTGSIVQHTTAGVDEWDITETMERLTTGATVQYTPLATLTNRLTFGYDLTQQEARNIRHVGFLLFPQGGIDNNTYTRRYLSFDYVGPLTFDILGNLSSSLSWGGQATGDFTSEVEAFGEGFPGTKLPTVNSASKTLGFVYSPGFIQGLDISLDWWQVEIDDAIFLQTGQAILDNCYRNGTDAACALISRTSSGQVSDLLSIPSNIGTIDTEGYDFTVLSALEAVDRVLAAPRAGAFTPARYFGADFVKSIPGTEM
jgi:hypothetical protein